MNRREALIEEWVSMARELGRQHATGLGSDDRPEDAVDLNAWEAVTGEGMSMGELIDIQEALTSAYEEGKSES